MTVLDRVQRLLEALYHVDLGLSVVDFQIGERQLHELVELGAAGVGAKEQLLVLEEDGESSLALYIADEVLHRLRERDPLRALTPENLADFCLLAEGVSHFLYYAWRARRGERVTQLELELQAEVDKYIACFLAHWEQDRGRFPAELRTSLFRRVAFRPGLAHDETDRYQTANRLAMRYCEHLERAYLRAGELPRAVPDLRRFYRLTHPGKLERIAALQ